MSIFVYIVEVGDLKGGVVKGPYAHANTAVAFLYACMATAEGVFSLERHGHVTAVAATGLYPGILDFGCGFGAGEGCWFVARLGGFAIETAICEFGRAGGRGRGRCLRLGGEG